MATQRSKPLPLAAEVNVQTAQVHAMNARDDLLDVLQEHLSKEIMKKIARALLEIGTCETLLRNITSDCEERDHAISGRNSRLDS